MRRSHCLLLLTPALAFLPPQRVTHAPLRSAYLDCLDRNERLAADECAVDGGTAPPRTVAPLLDGPVYSLATLDEQGDTNMNIVTYATPVGIRPERRWALSLYKDTMTRANFARRRRGVLQLLREEHAPLAYFLGGTSGVDGGKAVACFIAGFGWEASDWAERVLPRCAAYVSLEALGEPHDCGDHEVYICRVADGVAGFDTNHVTTGALRDLGLITAQGRAVAPEDMEIAPKRWRGLKRLLGAVSAAAAVALLPFHASAAGSASRSDQGLTQCRSKPGAVFAVRTCRRYGLQSDGRLAGCLPSENCVSSSAIKSPAQFDAPWLFAPSTRDADAAFANLVRAAEAAPDMTVAEANKEQRYLRATAPSQISNYKATDLDDIEIKIDAEKGLAFHRSASREAVFFFPPQNIYSVPLGDGGSNLGRLEALRRTLGWESTNPRPEDTADDPKSYQALSRSFGM